MREYEMKEGGGSATHGNAAAVKFECKPEAVIIDGGGNVTGNPVRENDQLARRQLIRNR